MRILKVSAADLDSDARELEFELDFFARLSTAERFELMFRRSREMAERLRAYGYGEPAPILKRQ
jgi:hypothetical protein